MEQEGLSEIAIRAFLYQYAKLKNPGPIGMIPENQIDPIDTMPSIMDVASRKNSPTPAEISELLGKTAVIKLNGGLGTGMGLDRAKTLLQVRGDLTFLDVILKQFQRLKQTSDTRLFFLNSFSTSADTLNVIRSYPDLGDAQAMELLQNKVPKLEVTTLEPIVWPTNPQLEWCPPGHGDLYLTLVGSGWLDRLLDEGKKYLFVSNADNLGATLDLTLLRYFAELNAPFMMEVTRRTDADRKGGHLARRKADGRLSLRESAQCPDADLADFQNIKRHRYFNTNNLWIHLGGLKEALNRGEGFLPLPLIRNEKTVDPRDKKSPKVYQLETAMGAAIECFDGAQAIEVPRVRFAPVKTTQDLLGVRSDAYILDDEFRLSLRPERNGLPPVITLDDSYKLYDQLEGLGAVPSLVECQSLRIEGRIRFSEGVKLVGRVTIRNQESTVKVLASGTYRDTIVTL
jgi:UDP-N-acetylglucosamine pyrophosphorylase